MTATFLSNGASGDYVLVRGDETVPLRWFMAFLFDNVGPGYDLRHLTVEIIP